MLYLTKKSRKDEKNMNLHIRYKKMTAGLLTAALSFGIFSISPVQAATSLKLSKKTATVTVNKSITITANKNVSKWKSSNKAIATVKKISNKKAKITGRKKGTCKITAKSGKKTVKVKITVHAKAIKTPTVTKLPAATSTPVISATPFVTNTPIVTTKPVITTTPIATEPSQTATPVVTETPVVTSIPAITEVPTAIATTTPTLEQPASSAPPVPTGAPMVTIAPSITTGPATTLDISNVKISCYYKENNQSILTLQNDTAVNFEIDKNEYYLEKKTETGWNSLPATDIYRDPDPVQLQANSILSYSLQYLDDYGTLPSGTYRIVVPLHYNDPYSKDASTYYVSCEFIIGALSTEKLSMTVTPNVDKKLSVTLQNNNSYSVKLDQSDYNIERWENDTWLPLPSIAILTPERPITLEANTTNTFSIDYTEYFGSLPSGTYRIVLPVWQTENTSNRTVLYQTFTLD